MLQELRKYKPVDLIPFKLKDISDFVVDEHPVIHPKDPRYNKYWIDQTKKCLDGMWGYDYNEKEGGGYRFMPGNLYFYINMCVIKNEDDYGNDVTENPTLRDVDWLLFYTFAACEGFSGFEDDTERSAFRPLGKYQNGEPLTNIEKRFLKLFDEHLRKPNGEYKEYVEARELLYATHDKPLGRAEFLNEKLNLILLSTRRGGKMLLEDEDILTTNGWIKLKDLKETDIVYGSDGNPCSIDFKTDLQEDLNMFEITLADGRKIKACEDHLWKIYSIDYNQNKNQKPVYKTKSTKDLYKKYYRERVDSHARKKGIEKTKKEYLHYIPLNKPVEFDKKDQTIDPYFLGLWLGDGTSNRVGITTADDEIRDFIYQYAKEWGCNVSINENKTKTCPTYFVTKGNFVGNKERLLTNEFKRLNLFNNKHIPKQYLQGSKEQRLALLQGMMDSDGTAPKSGKGFEYYSSDKRLANQFAELARSLGMYVSIKEKDAKIGDKDYGISYRVRILTKLPIFRLSRKKEIHDKSIKNKRNYSRYERVAIVDIKPAGKGKGYCIGVNNDDHTYITKDYIVTHNSYSISNGLVGHDFVFDGARSFEDFMSKKNQSKVIVGSVKSDYSEEFLEKFHSSYMHLKENLGAYRSEDYKKEGWFFSPTSGVHNRIGSAYTKRVRTKDGQGFVGSGSSIIHVSFHDNPNAAVGHGAKRIVIEEAGLLQNFNDVDAENKAILEKRRKFGWVAYLGTGGNMKKIQEIKNAFYNPDAVSAIKFYDHFSGSNRPIGLFIPSYYRKLDYKDPQGNTLIQEAWDDEMAERKEQKKAGSKFYQRHITSFPVVPEEMFVETGTNIFPIEKLAERKLQLEEGEFKRIATVGSLIYTDKARTKVRFKPDLEKKLTPILEYGVEGRMKAHEKKGAVVIYEHPDSNLPKPTYKKPRYLTVVDQVRNEEDGPSLCAVLVYKFYNLEDPGTMQMNVVAEWIGRLPRIEDNHEMAFKLATYYNSKILPEINIVSIKTYARTTRRFDMLQPRPSIALDGNFKQNKTYDVGVLVTKGMIPDLETYTEQLLTTEIDSYEKIEGDAHIYESITVADRLNSPRLISELMAYRRDSGNYDAVSAFFLVGVFFLQYKKELVRLEMTEDEKDILGDYKKFLSSATKQPSRHAAFDY